MKKLAIEITGLNRNHSILYKPKLIPQLIININIVLSILNFSLLILFFLKNFLHKPAKTIRLNADTKAKAIKETTKIYAHSQLIVLFILSKIKTTYNYPIPFARTKYY
jgi:hypothetical protein